jgi:hypothetical protein
MGLRQIAEADLGVILEDSETGFGWCITVTDPSGSVAILTGFSNDIALAIDPSTGQAVSGRTVTVALRQSSLYAVGMTVPAGIPDKTKSPWVVEFDDVNGFRSRFKITEVLPDRALGITICRLEFYKT